MKIRTGLFLLLFISSIIAPSGYCHGQGLDSLLIVWPNKAYQMASKAMQEDPRAAFLAVMIEANLNLGNYERADSLYCYYSPILEQSSVDSNDLMEVQRSIARVYAIQFRFEESFTLFDQALNYYSAKKNEEKAALTKVNLAEYYRIISQLEPANELLLSIINKPGFEENISGAVKANVYHRLAAISRKKTNSQKQALIYLQKSLSYSEPIQHLGHMATAYTELGDIYQELQDPLAQKYLHKALEAWERLGYSHYQANVHLNLVRYLLGIGDLDAAMKHLNAAISIGAIYPALLNMALEFKATILFKQGQYKEAFIIRDSCANLRVELMRKQHDKDILEVSRKFQTDISKAELKTSKKQEDLAIIKAEQEKKLRKGFAVGVVFLLILIGVVTSLYYILRREKLAISSKNKIIGVKNEQLSLSLQEKDTLLREVHHRVKNNLQIISSLIEMQKLGSSSNLINEAGVHALLGRINTMGLVHQRLYSQDVLGSVQVKGYLEDLISHLRLMDLGPKPASIRLNCDVIRMDISTSISLGMIVNELVYNSMKHAFSMDHPNPEISMELSLLENEQIKFCYRDNGQGINAKGEEGFGMRLVRMFARQLVAEVNLDNSNGFKLSLNFSIINE